VYRLGRKAVGCPAAGPQDLLIRVLNVKLEPVRGWTTKLYQRISAAFEEPQRDSLDKGNKFC
jgi:hypothetical protein